MQAANRLSRRRVIAGLLGAGLVPRPSRAASALRLTVTGQALIQHDLRQHPWPDFALLAARFAQADLCFTDLETAIRSPKADPPTRQDVFLHAADPDVLDCLKAWNFGLLATANNHAYDLGTGGIVGTVEELDRRALVHGGIGVDLTAASAPVYCQTANGTVALVAVASGAIREGGAATASRPGVNELRVDTDREPAGVNSEDAGRMLAAIRAAASRAQIVLAYHHNHVLADKGRRVPAWQQQLAHQCIDAGATLFVSHGAPWLLGIEMYRRRPIFYDLGSLVFQTATGEGAYEADVWQSVIAECRFADGGFTEMTLTPVQLNDRGLDGDLATRGRPSLAHGTEAAATLDRLAALSQPFGTRIERSDDSGLIRV